MMVMPEARPSTQSVSARMPGMAFMSRHRKRYVLRSCERARARHGAAW